MALSDAVVVGAGVVGLATAYALARRGRSVVVVDKEPTLGAHASGRNSGVLHAGFYYSDESLKAELSARGNRRWRVLCDDDGVPVNPCGKLVVARSAAEVPVVQALVENAVRHGVAPREEGGRVSVKVVATPAAVRVTVMDDGPGLPASARATVRGDGPADAGTAGAGGGLRNTVERVRLTWPERARVEIGSTTGACLTLVLPYDEEAS